MSKYADGIFVAENEMRQHRLLGNAEHFFQEICSSRCHCAKPCGSGDVKNLFSG